MTLLKLIHIKQEFPNIWSFVFEKPQGFFYYPGQYIDVRLDNTKDPYPTRAFTLSSSPTEDFLMVTTRLGHSEYKKTLRTLKAGDTITISHPSGTFSYDHTEPGVFVARGIGITPFRSIIKHLTDTNQPHKPIDVYYIDHDQNFLFHRDLQCSNIHYNNDPPLNLNDQIYYLSGPPKFVKEIYQKLIDRDIAELNIRVDQFDGY